MWVVELLTVLWAARTQMRGAVGEILFFFKTPPPGTRTYPYQCYNHSLVDTQVGPITITQARQLNYPVLSFLGTTSNAHKNMMLPKLDSCVLLKNEGSSMHG